MYIRKEQIQVEIERLNKKVKGKYRFKAQAKTPLYTIQGSQQQGYLSSEIIFSKTKHGAKISALISLYHRCRPPLTRQQKLKNRQLKKEGEKEIKPTFFYEIRHSNSIDFIMDDANLNSFWYHNFN